MAPSSLPAVRRVGSGPLRATNVLYPLDRAYAAVGLPPPRARVLTPSLIPDPQRTLLVQESDMTSVLERHIAARLAVRPLWIQSRRRWYMRRVLLCSLETGRVVSMGVIRLDMEAFGERLRGQILRAAAPLGRLLTQTDFEYRSAPVAFFALTPGADLLGMFGMAQPLPLYGRRTQALVRGVKVGDIVEVLAPL